jgi:hypothetical protein
MLVDINRINHIVTVTKEKGDPIFHRSNWADAESTFLYHVKKQLQNAGYDVIKKRMWKDGHMVDDTQQYIRERNWEWCIYNNSWATYDAGEIFNEDGVVYLRFEDWK